MADTGGSRAGRGPGVESPRAADLTMADTGGSRARCRAGNDSTYPEIAFRNRQAARAITTAA